MNSRLSPIAVAAMMTALLVGACATDHPVPVGPAAGGATQLVMSVEGVELFRDANGLVITAKGLVNTGGWSDPQLQPLQTFAPEVGIQSYTFVATPPKPDEMVVQMITEVTATTTIHPVPDDLKEIKVMAEGGEVVVPVPTMTP